MNDTFCDREPDELLGRHPGLEESDVELSSEVTDWGQTPSQSYEFKESFHREPVREENLVGAVVAQCQIEAFFNEEAQARIPLKYTHGGNLCFVDNTLATSCSEGVQDESMNDTFSDREPDELLRRHPGSHFVLAPHLKHPEELL